MNESIFESTINKFPKVEDNLVCDILIIGGGITGISLAYYLKDTKFSTILIEQSKIGGSTTRFSTAKLTFFQQDILSKIKKARNKRDSYLYYKSQKEAISRIVNIVKKESISCNLERSPSYLFVRDKSNVKKLKDEVNLYREFGASVELCSKLPFGCGEVLCAAAEDNYVFNPVKYIDGLLTSTRKSDNVKLYENTRMMSMKRRNNLYVVTLDNKKQILAKKIVFAGHYPPFIFPYLFPSKCYIEKDFAGAKKVGNFKFNAINLDKDIFSIRFYDDYLMKVIKSTKLNNSSIDNNPLDDEKYEYKWINYDLITQDSLPIIGKIKKDLYIATGYNTWGMTNSNLAAVLLRDLLLNNENPYKNLVNPRRIPTFVTIFNSVIDNITMIFTFIASYFPLSNKPKIVIENGNRVGITKDKDGNIHKVLLACPHMKCGLKFNKLTNTWDCPCHGSRFDIDGNLLRGPATKCVGKNRSFNEPQE